MEPQTTILGPHDYYLSCISRCYDVMRIEVVRSETKNKEDTLKSHLLGLLEVLAMLSEYMVLWTGLYIAGMHWRKFLKP